VKYVFILDNNSIWTISALCRVLKVSRPGFYTWLKRPLSPRTMANQQLDRKIQDAFDKHKSRYGASCITLELKSKVNLSAKTGLLTE